jgi:hypothetical protein
LSKQHPAGEILGDIRKSLSSGSFFSEVRELIHLYHFREILLTRVSSHADGRDRPNEEKACSWGCGREEIKATQGLQIKRSSMLRFY